MLAHRACRSGEGRSPLVLSRVCYTALMIIKIVDAILVHNNRILLVQQKNPRAYGSWSLPGGHVEGNESPEEAIQRELKEELGIKLPNTAIGKHEHIESKTDEGSLLVCTFTVYIKPQAYLVQENEVVGFGWFTLDELSKMSAKFTIALDNQDG